VAGRFITFEGGEGAGKTTVIEAVEACLTGRSESLFADHEVTHSGFENVVKTREPGAGVFGSAIRELLLHSDAMPPESELFLFLADRANHVERTIRPVLARGETILCDRFADSTLVYQAFVRGLDEAFVRAANEVATGGLKPNLTILLDIDPAIGLARIKAKNRLDREPLEFHRKVREGFLRLAAEEPERWRIVDAGQSQREVLAQVLTHLRP
jgi:dTMP kinase